MKEHSSSFGASCPLSFANWIASGQNSFFFSVSVKDPTRECFLSIPTVVGVQGAESVLEIRPHLNYAEAQKYDATADTLEHMCAQLPPVGPMTRTDALDAGAARKEAYEEAA